MRISSIASAGIILLASLTTVSTAGAQQTQSLSSSTQAVTSVQGKSTQAKAPGPFASDSAIEERLQEIVELAKKSSEDKHRYDIRTLTCSEFLRLSASTDPDDYAVMAMLMVWTHGYHSGLKGINFQAYPLDTHGVVSLTTQMVSVCKKHPRELFHVAATHLD